MRDDLGTPVNLPTPPERVVSLVPSLTEAIAATRPGVLVGATDFCTHPHDLAVARARGTKNPDLAAIAALRPDVVVANEEENRQLDVTRLRERGISVWVTRIDTLDEALTSLGRLCRLLGAPDPAWLTGAARAWAPPPRLDVTVAVPIWRDPWLWVGTQTYAADVLARVGARVVTNEPRYPRLDPGDVVARHPGVVLLPDEPYAFAADDGPDALPGATTQPVAGRDLFWYGPAMVDARAHLEGILTDVSAGATPTDGPAPR